MKTVEIIHLRLAGDSPEDLMDMVRECIGAEINQMEFRFYRNVKLANDLAVHLLREAGGKADGVSDVGIRLASLLKDHGMVSHSVWTEHCHLVEGSTPDEIV
jgi:hypothetical protein